MTTVTVSLLVSDPGMRCLNVLVSMNASIVVDTTVFISTNGTARNTSLVVLALTCISGTGRLCDLNTVDVVTRNVISGALTTRKRQRVERLCLLVSPVLTGSLLLVRRFCLALLRIALARRFYDTTMSSEPLVRVAGTGRRCYTALWRQRPLT